jgi:3'(2'), 5'-bisphosphate nucleotidase
MISNLEFLEILPSIQEACIKAGKMQKKYHKTDIDISTKANKTPVTKIDIDSNIIISDMLKKITPDIPIISEEDYEGQDKHDSFWIVDPLDGTRNYLDRGNNFCICISLIKESYPILGVIYSPVKDYFYYAYHGCGAFLMRGPTNPIKIQTSKMSKDKNNVFTSISINKSILKQISAHVENVLFVKLASALKFGAIASGEGCFYPRLGPTHEWDTAAGQCLIEEAGGSVVDKHMDRLKYNKNSQFLNDEFFVIADPTFDWKSVIDNIIFARKLIS